MTQTEINELNIGDKVTQYVRNSRDIYRLFQITRVTSTQAFIARADKNELRFKRTMLGTSIKELGADSWSIFGYRLTTEQDLQQFRKQELVSKIGKVKFEDLPIEILENILSHLNTTA